MGSVILGVNNLISSTTEIILHYFTKYQGNTQTKAVLKSLLDNINQIKISLPKYNCAEAKGQVIKCEESEQIEKQIKECLLTVFDIDIQDKIKYMSDDKVIEYKKYVSALLDEIIKCKSHIVYEGAIMPMVKGNDELKRESCKHSRLSDIWERSRLLTMEEFDNACFYFKIDPHALREVIDLYSDKLILAIIDIAYVQFLVEKRYFPPENIELSDKVERSYKRLVNHIILSKHFQSMIQLNAENQTNRLHVTRKKNVKPGDQSITQTSAGNQTENLHSTSKGNVKTSRQSMCQSDCDGTVQHLSSGKENMKKRLVTYLGIVVIVTQLLFNICMLLFILMYIHTIIDLISFSNVIISICSVNAILTTVSFILICIPESLKQREISSVVDNFTVNSVNVNAETVDL